LPTSQSCSTKLRFAFSDRALLNPFSFSSLYWPASDYFNLFRFILLDRCVAARPYQFRARCASVEPSILMRSSPLSFKAVTSGMSLELRLVSPLLGIVPRSPDSCRLGQAHKQEYRRSLTQTSISPTSTSPRHRTLGAARRHLDESPFVVFFLPNVEAKLLRRQSYVALRSQAGITLRSNSPLNAIPRGGPATKRGVT